MYYITLALGIFLVLSGIIALKFGWPSVNDIQRFEGLGIRLEISVATLLILLGSICILSNLIINIFNQQNKDQEISRKKTEYETKKDEYEILISNLKNQKVTVFIELPIADQPLYYNFDLKKLNLTYVKDLDPKQLRADTIKGYDGTQLSFEVQGVNPYSTIRDVILFDPISNKKWRSNEEVRLLIPKVKLK